MNRKYLLNAIQKPGAQEEFFASVMTDVLQIEHQLPTTKSGSIRIVGPDFLTRYPANLHPLVNALGDLLLQVV